MVRKTYPKSAHRIFFFEVCFKKNSEKSLLILDSSNLVHLFSMTSYTVLIKIKVVKNDVINNFELHDQLTWIYSFHSTASEVGEIQSFYRKNRFLGNFRGS